MTKFTNALLAGAFAAATLAAPAAMAQTSPQAQSTGGVEHLKDQKDADKTRMQSGTSSGSSSSASTAEPAPSPNAAEKVDGQDSMKGKSGG